MAKSWRKKYFPNPLQIWIGMVGILWAAGALISLLLPKMPTTPFVFMALICFGVSWVLNRSFRDPSQQNRIQG